MLLNHSVLSISAFSKLYILLFEPENIFESFKLTITDFLVDTYGDTIFGFMDADLTPILNDLNKKNVDTLLVHCYASRSRSRAVGAFAVKMLGGDNSRYFEEETSNMYIYDVLVSAWIRKCLSMI